MCAVSILIFYNLRYIIDYTPHRKNLLSHRKLVLILTVLLFKSTISIAQLKYYQPDTSYRCRQEEHRSHKVFSYSYQHTFSFARCGYLNIQEWFKNMFTTIQVFCANGFTVFELGCRLFISLKYVSLIKRRFVPQSYKSIWILIELKMSNSYMSKDVREHLTHIFYFIS